MNNNLLLIKIKQRLNKLASLDFDNIEPWMVGEAFNKTQNEWSRRKRHGMNQFREGDEGSKQAIDDLQILLTQTILKGVSKPKYFETLSLPENYIAFKRVSVEASSPCCAETKQMVVYLSEEANIDQVLRDEHKKPSFAWAETICTLINKKIRVYTGADFSIQEVQLTYYRLPRQVKFAGQMDPASGQTLLVDSECEFNDEVTDILIDLTASTLAGDIENFNQVSRLLQNAEHNT